MKWFNVLSYGLRPKIYQIWPNGVIWVFSHKVIFYIYLTSTKDCYVTTRKKFEDENKILGLMTTNYEFLRVENPL